VLCSGFRFLDGNNPADPFIASKWRNIFPLCPRRRVSNESLSQIRWYVMHCTGGDSFLGHTMRKNLIKWQRFLLSSSQGQSAEMFW
jgi:hypothetical protein